MKKYLYILLIMCLLNNVIAQEEVVKPKIKIEQSIGVNTASVLRKMLKVSPDSSNANSYLLMYKLRIGKNGIRMSGLANLNSETEKVAGFADSKTLRTSNYAARVGYERQSNAGKRFTFSYGVDAVWEYRENSLNSDTGLDNVTITKLQRSMGGGPFLGLTWQLSKHLSLYSEVGMYYMVGRKVNLTDFVKNPEFNDIKEASDFSKINYVVPSGLFLQYHF